jgi:hypothetical protein
MEKIRVKDKERTAFTYGHRPRFQESLENRLHCKMMSIRSLQPCLRSSKKSPEVSDAPKEPRPPRQIYETNFDALLDPLPKAEVFESSTKTAWGRWEDLAALKKEMGL